MRMFKDVAEVYALETVVKEHIKSYASSSHCPGCVDKAHTQKKATEGEPKG